MRLSRLVLSLLPASLLLFGCGQQAPRPANTATQATRDYVTVVPSVSVSRTAEEVELAQARLDPDADVMAEILAIPPGR